MKSVILAAVLAVFSVCAIAAPWTIDTLERHVQETNFSLAGRCSATLIDREAGLILTAEHCLRGDELGDHVSVKQQIYSGHEVIGIFMTQAEYVATDATNDLALLVLSDSASAPFPMEATLATEAPGVGHTVWAVGNPIGLDNTVTRGVLSAKHRINDEREYWQTDAGLYKGSSGGAVYNDNGELIGVVSAGATVLAGFQPVPLGFNFIVPLDRIQALIERHNAEQVDADTPAQ